MWTNDEVSERSVWTFDDEVESEEYEGENGRDDEGQDYSADSLNSVEAQPLLLTEREAFCVDNALIFCLEETNVEIDEIIRRIHGDLRRVQERLRNIHF